MQEVLLKKKATLKFGEKYYTRMKKSAVLTWDEIEFKAKCIKQVKEGHFILITDRVS